MAQEGALSPRGALFACLFAVAVGMFLVGIPLPYLWWFLGLPLAWPKVALFMGVTALLSASAAFVTITAPNGHQRRRMDSKR